MPEQEIFLSWSKPASKAAAEAFREYLPQLLPGVKPWMSSLDIEKGTGWFGAISGQLARSRACLLLITPENIASSWLYYEAGAVAHAFSGTRVFPYLLGVKAGELGATPLGQYQVTLFEKEDTKKLIHDLNKTLEEPIHETVLSSAFDGVWPKLYRKLNKIPLTKPVDPPAPPTAPPAPPPLSDEAARILVAAAGGKEHKVYVNSSMHGQNISAGDTSFLENSREDRKNAMFLAAVGDLVNRGFIEDRWGKGEVYAVVRPGYAAADQAKKLLPPELSEEAKKILLATSAGKDGQVMGHQDFEGFHLSAGGKQVCRSDDDRIVAGFHEALEDLVKRGNLSVEGEDNYQITKSGYKAADELRKSLGTPTLSDEAKEILIRAAIGKSGHIALVKDKGFHLVGDNNANICGTDDARIEANYRAGMQELLAHDLVEPVGRAGEVFRVTRHGHMLAPEVARDTKPVPSIPPITDEADILVHLQGWMAKQDKGTHTPPITFADVDRDLNLPPGSAARLLERAAAKLHWMPDSKGPNVIVFKKVGAPGSAPQVINPR